MTSRNEFVYDPGNHVGYLNGRRIPSVTQCINETLGPQWQVDEWYLDRGTKIHQCAAILARGNEIAEHDPRIEGHVQALEKWFSRSKPEDCVAERVRCSVEYRFFGTPDLICTHGRYKRVVIVDFKSSLQPQRLGLQLAGYSVLSDVRYGLGVEVRDDGSFKETALIDLKPLTREFRACRNAYAIKEKYGCLSERQN